MRFLRCLLMLSVLLFFVWIASLVAQAPLGAPFE